MRLAVEKGHPVPDVASRLRTGKYPWEDCREVGDSFFVPCPSDDRPRVRKSVMSAASRWRAKTGSAYRFVSDYDTDKAGNAGVRVWRKA